MYVAFMYIYVYICTSKQKKPLCTYFYVHTDIYISVSYKQSQKSVMHLFKYRYAYLCTHTKTKDRCIPNVRVCKATLHDLFLTDVATWDLSLKSLETNFLARTSKTKGRSTPLLLCRGRGARSMRRKGLYKLMWNPRLDLLR